MNDEFSNLHYSPILNHDYSHWFESMSYNGKTLSTKERIECITVFDEIITLYSEGLPIIQESIDSCKELHDKYHETERILSSVILFVYMTMLDCMVSGKYFMAANLDYERRFMRGKMKVILNEGFKKLYGFEGKTHKMSEWARLQPLMEQFPEAIKQQYKDLTGRLDDLAKSSPWWRDERNYETHLVAEKLYKSRQEEVIESKVMMDSMTLFNTLYAVSLFLTNVHGQQFNFLLGMYERGELQTE